MKMNRCIYFLLFTLISFQLTGMEFASREAEVEFWAQKYSKKTTAELLAIAENSPGLVYQDAATKVLSERAILAAAPKVISVSTSLNSNSGIDGEFIIINGIGIIALLGVIWGVTEACLAYKNINKEEWKEADGFAKKSALIAFKTGAAMASRPSQAFASGKDIINKIFR